MRHLSLSIAALLQLLACGGPQRPTPENQVKVSTDRAGLQRHIHVPDGLGEVVWAARPVGTPGIGPTDLELLAWFPLTDTRWRSLADTLGPEGHARTLTVPPVLLDAVGVDSATGNALPCSAYETSQCRCVGAIRRTDGLLVYLSSR